MLDIGHFRDQILRSMRPSTIRRAQRGSEKMRVRMLQDVQSRTILPCGYTNILCIGAIRCSCQNTTALIHKWNGRATIFPLPIIHASMSQRQTQQSEKLLDPMKKEFIVHSMSDQWLIGSIFLRWKKQKEKQSHRSGHREPPRLHHDFSDDVGHAPVRRRLESLNLRHNSPVTFLQWTRQSSVRRRRQ